MTELYKKSLSDIFLQFSNIPISELEELVNLFSLQEFKKKSIIIAPNNTSDIKLFFVVGEREVTIDFKEENTLFANGFTLFTNLPNIDYYVALEDVVCLVAESNEIEVLASKYHSIEHLNRKIVEAYYASYLITNYNSLFLSAEERYSVFVRDRAALINRLPLKYIATYLGIKQETLSRLRAKKIITI